MADWKSYLKFNLISDFSGALPEKYGIAAFEFGKLFSGAKERRPRWKRVINAEEGAMGEMLGKLYVKEFFNESIQTSDGEEVTSEELNSTLINVINEEDKSNPMSDEQLVSVLRDRGFVLSRRTIAKYRERLNIPVARLRREM